MVLNINSYGFELQPYDIDLVPPTSFVLLLSSTLYFYVLLTRLYKYMHVTIYFFKFAKRRKEMHAFMLSFIII